MASLSSDFTAHFHADLRHRLHDAANTASGLCGLLDLHGETGDGSMLDYANQAARCLIAEIQAIRAQIDGAGTRFPRLAWLDAHELLDEIRPVAEGLAALHERNLRIIPVGVVQVFGDSGMLHRALLNLVKNAFEACPAGGTVEISVTTSASRARLQVAHPGLMGAESRQPLRGCLPDLPQARRGLGLAGVARTMDGLCGARLGCDSGEDLGTRFWLELPSLQPEPTPRRG